MILIPELDTVVILVPRTGTTALKHAIRDKYPDSFMLYRHMEADGVPHAYDRWQKVGVIRDPVERLFSLYKYCREFSKHRTGPKFEAYRKAHEAATACDFNEWLLTNKLPFNNQYDSATPDRVHPLYACLHSIPENRKSQHLYLRPELDTRIFAYEDLNGLGDFLGVDLPHTNASTPMDMPTLTPEAVAHCYNWFKWDFRVHGELLAKLRPQVA